MAPSLSCMWVLLPTILSESVYSFCLWFFDMLWLLRGSGFNSVLLLYSLLWWLFFLDLHTKLIDSYLTYVLLWWWLTAATSRSNFLGIISFSLAGFYCLWFPFLTQAIWSRVDCRSVTFSFDNVRVILAIHLSSSFAYASYCLSTLLYLIWKILIAFHCFSFKFIWH